LTAARRWGEQVYPIKPTLKAPGPKRLKQGSHKTAFNFCFQVQLAPLDVGEMRVYSDARGLQQLAAFGRKAGASLSH